MPHSQTYCRPSIFLHVLHPKENWKRPHKWGLGDLHPCNIIASIEAVRCWGDKTGVNVLVLTRPFVPALLNFLAVDFRASSEQSIHLAFFFFFSNNVLCSLGVHPHPLMFHVVWVGDAPEILGGHVTQGLF